MMPDAPHSVPNPAGSSLGMRRQFEIYQLGWPGRSFPYPFPWRNWKRKLPKF
jgi:hypothetical protein